MSRLAAASLASIDSCRPRPAGSPLHLRRRLHSFPALLPPHPISPARLRLFPESGSALSRDVRPSRSRVRRLQSSSLRHTPSLNSFLARLLEPPRPGRLFDLQQLEKARQPLCFVLRLPSAASARAPGIVRTSLLQSGDLPSRSSPRSLRVPALIALEADWSWLSRNLNLAHSLPARLRR